MQERFRNIMKDVQPAPVVDFNPASETIAAVDLTSNNPTLTTAVFGDTISFTAYMDAIRLEHHARFLVGGYDENRDVYSRSEVFDGSEPRRIHLGIDIWGNAGEKIFAPLEGMVHSFAFNDRYGDYGATVILAHNVDGSRFHTLYGHLSEEDLKTLYKGKKTKAGECIAHFGQRHENGHWPPHLHFQVIFDMEGNKGDYPGVCSPADRMKYLSNCPDPDMLLRMNRYLQ